METEKVGNSSDMDAVMAYQNLLAAENHLDELIFRASDSEERFTLRAMLAETINLRDEIMPAEQDPTKHCLVKHYAAAYEGLRERWKDLRTDEAYLDKQHAYDLLVSSLEMLWGRSIITCERCDYERTIRRDTKSTFDDGEPRGAIQAVSDNREPSIQGVPEARTSGSRVSSSQPESDSGEELRIAHHHGNSHREDH